VSGAMDEQGEIVVEKNHGKSSAERRR